MRSATLAVIIVGVIALAGFGAPTPDVMAPTTAADPTIHLVSLNPWVQATDEVTAVVDVSGAPEGSTLRPVLHTAVPTRSAFALTTNGKNLAGTEARLSEHELTGSSSSVTIRFTVTDGTTPTPDADSATLTRTGVYPLAFSVEGPEGNDIASMVAYLVRLPAAPEEGSNGRRPLRLASEFRLQPRPVITTTGEPVIPASSRQSITAFLDGLDATPEAVRRSFGFALSPALIDALAAPSSTTGAKPADRTRDAQAVEDLATLTDGLPLQAQPWAPVDPAGWLATPDLAPLFGRSLEQGDDVLAAHIHSPDTATIDLAAWGGRTSDQTLRWFTQHGATSFLLPEQALTSLDTSAFPRSLAAPFLLDIGNDRTVPAMQLDEGIAQHFASADPILGANQLIADLSVIALDLPSISRGMVVAPPSGWTPSARFLSAYVAALDSAHPSASDPLLAPTPLTGVVQDTPPARTAGDTATEGPTLVRSLRQGDAPPPQSVLGRQVSRTDASVSSLAAMVPGGPAASEALISGLRHEMNVAAMPGVSQKVRTDRFGSIRRRVEEIAGSIRLPPRQTITLTSDSASLPLTIRRSADGPTKAVIHIDAPSRLEFPEGRTQPVRLENPTTRLDIRVHSDSPGDTIVRVTVTSPDSRLVAGTSELVVRSTTTSGVGLIISFGSLAFLILWWGRDIIRSRRRRRARHVPPAELIDID